MRIIRRVLFQILLLFRGVALVLSGVFAVLCMTGFCLVTFFLDAHTPLSWENIYTHVGYDFYVN